MREVVVSVESPVNDARCSQGKNLINEIKNLGPRILLVAINRTKLLKYGCQVVVQKLD